MKQYLIMGLTALALLGGAFAYGYHKGAVNQIEKFEADRVKLQTEILDLNKDLSERSAEIVRLQREREGLINELENEAITAPGSSNPGVAATGGLRRLEERWGKGFSSSD